MRFAAAFGVCVFLVACAGGPPAPDWKVNSLASLRSFEAAYLGGSSRAAEVDFARARSDLAATGRADLVARAELVRCAARVASLEFDTCPGFTALAADAGAPERAYATFLSGDWKALDAAALPAQHRSVVAGAGGDLPEEPFARLVAAGALMRAGRITPAQIAAAVDVASANGWRRPLLAWLGVQAKRAEAAGDNEATARIRRRIELVTGGGK